MGLYDATRDVLKLTRETLESATTTSPLKNTRKELDLTNPNPTRYMLTTWRDNESLDTIQTTHCP